MVSVRFRALLNTLFVVAGALLVGQSLHLSVVTGQQEVFAPATLGRASIGVLLVVLGQIVHNPVDEAENRHRRREAEIESDTGGEFDPELSPVGEELDERER